MSYNNWLNKNNIPNYPSDSDYTTNSPSYYENLARKQKLIKLLAKKIWEYEEKLELSLEEIEDRLETYIKQNDDLMKDRLDQWDKGLEEFPDNVESLLQDWLSDGTLDHIINETIFNWKVDQTEFDEFAENTTSQLAHTANAIVENKQDVVKIFNHVGQPNQREVFIRHSNNDRFDVFINHDGFVKCLMAYLA